MDQHTCLICQEGITNPVCPECLEKQVMYWISEIRPSLVNVLKRVGESVKEFDFRSTDCVLCGRNLNICPHCYCDEIHAWLKENGFEEIAERFLYHFNFELECWHDMRIKPAVLQ